MRIFKYLILALFFFLFSRNAQALDIQYGSILGWKKGEVLVQYYGIEVKNNYLCNTTTLACNETKIKNLGKDVSKKPSKSMLKKLKKAHDSHITLSPSGKFLAYYHSAGEKENTSTFSLKDLKNKKDYKLSENTTYWDLVEDQGKVFEFSPDKKTLLYLNDSGGTLALYKVDTTKLGGKNLTSEKIPATAYSIDDFLMFDTKTLYYVGNTKDNPYTWSLYRRDMKTGSEKIIETSVSYYDSLIKLGNKIAFGHLEQKGFGPELYDTTNGKLETFNIPGINPNKNIHNQEIIQTNSAHGILMTPDNVNNTNSYPLVVWLHGGPYRQTSFGYHSFHSYGLYDSILELLRKDSVIVLKLDYRGSLGFGRAYAESLKNQVGKGDVNDVMDAVSYAKSRYNISNVYLAGNSYGGYLSLKSLAEHPETFTGVVSINGVTDWQSLLVKMQKSIFNTQFGGLPDAHNQVLYDQASIINNISKIGNQKILIVQGQSDHTIPPWQANLLYDKLKDQNKNVTIVKYLKEDHVFKHKENISDLCVQMFNFIGLAPDAECNN